MKFVWEEAQNTGFINEYLHNEKEAESFFDYSLEDKSYLLRYGDLKTRTFKRKELVDVLTNFNKKHHADDATIEMINKLQDERSVAVVGGQQAGLLTGPLYTINKIVSIIKYASDIERKHQIPVVPIFWIAGEDHDIDEVNHTFLHYEDQIKKVRIGERNDVKYPVSNRRISSVDGHAIIQELFQFLQETEYTRKLYDELVADINTDITYVDWCAKIIHRIFKGTGIILMDAACPDIRKIESDYFKQLIRKNDQLRGAFIEGALRYKKVYQEEPIDIDENNAHLFIHDQGQRYLLSKEREVFLEKDSNRHWTEEELLNEISIDPNSLSNNVVSRPLMQEFLLPVLSFVAGPGELKYWATLKEVFHTFQMRMPIVQPRLHFTFISRQSEKNLVKLRLDDKSVTKKGVEKEKEQWLIEQEKAPYKEQFQHAVEQIDEIFSHLSPTFQKYGEEFESLQETYREKAKTYMTQLETKFTAQLKKQNESGLRRFDVVQCEMKPNGNLQERQLNIFPYLNIYGPDLIERMLQTVLEEVCQPGQHGYIYL
ncbi:bacillithiol biosynthesis cysteine-adding enzyme BshC [Evansella halocellulosilytica]|uniref:bacillithiol biosynthesis cysteine-adding enzyme BshC n=1 Tax=Evansella halocellulosilytica TaxID=2011013 RepID=UPI000BB6B547|nr:bacillithiol biosynthesis cysteine-adding enzyme BshC [Evansella halocellulosilytica]